MGVAMTPYLACCAITCAAMLACAATGVPFKFAPFVLFPLAIVSIHRLLEHLSDD